MGTAYEARVKARFLNGDRAVVQHLRYILQAGLDIEETAQRIIALLRGHDDL